MSPFLPMAVGAGEVSAPTVLPDELAPDEMEAELVDLLCDDQGWVDATFRDLVATSWAEPPRGGPVRPAARPRRNRVPARRASRHDGDGRSQWCPSPRGRQRGPPRRT